MCRKVLFYLIALIFFRGTSNYHTENLGQGHIVPSQDCNAATNNYFRYQYICPLFFFNNWLIFQRIKHQKIVRRGHCYWTKPKLTYSICFIFLTNSQKPKVVEFTIIENWVNRQIFKFEKLVQVHFWRLLLKKITLTISYQNCCRLSFCQTANQLIT